MRIASNFTLIRHIRRFRISQNSQFGTADSEKRQKSNVENFSDYIFPFAAIFAVWLCDTAVATLLQKSENWTSPETFVLYLQILPLSEHSYAWKIDKYSKTPEKTSNCQSLAGYWLNKCRILTETWKWNLRVGRWQHLSAVQVSKSGWNLDVQVRDCKQVFGVQVPSYDWLARTSGRHAKNPWWWICKHQLRISVTPVMSCLQKCRNLVGFWMYTCRILTGAYLLTGKMSKADQLLGWQVSVSGWTLVVQVLDFDRFLKYKRRFLIGWCEVTTIMPNRERWFRVLHLRIPDVSRHDFSAQLLRF